MSVTETEKWPVAVIRSAKRHKTVSAGLRGGVLFARASAGIGDEALGSFVARLQGRLRRKMRRTPESDVELERLAQRLNETYFAGRLRWRSIRYAGNLAKRFGSCEPSRGTIRISRRLATMPDWVLAYVVRRELAIGKKPIMERGSGGWWISIRWRSGRGAA